MQKIMLVAAACFAALGPVTSHAQTSDVDAARLARDQVIAENAKRLAIAEKQVALAEARTALKRAEDDLAAVQGTPPAATPPSNSDSSPAIANSDGHAVSAQNQPPNPNPTTKEMAAAEKFGKFPLGAGLSLTWDVGNTDRISDAAIVNDIVRAKDQNNTIARVMLESHFLFKPQKKFLGVEPSMWGIGPFVAIEPGGEDIINAISMGLMVGFRREKDKTDAFNIGLGIVIDPNTKVLGDGFLVNQAPPNGEKDIRFRETTQIGGMIMTSFSF